VEYDDHGRDSYHEELDVLASDEESDSDDTNKMSRRRDRFCTERRQSDTTAVQPTPSSNRADKRDIPDTLGWTCDVSWILSCWNTETTLIWAQCIVDVHGLN